MTRRPFVAWRIVGLCGLTVGLAGPAAAQVPVSAPVQPAPAAAQPSASLASLTGTVPQSVSFLTVLGSTASDESASSSIASTPNATLGTTSMQVPAIAFIVVDMAEMIRRQFIALEMVREGFPSDAIWGFLATGRIPLKAFSSTKDRGFFGGQAQTSSGGAAASTVSVVASFALGKSDFAHAIGFYGGARYDRVLTPRVGLYAQGEAGVTHFPGENSFTVIPSGGLEFLLGNKKYLLTVGLGIPIISFGPGDHEHGFQFDGGLVVPIR
jgi:hypothetical protein